MIEVSTMRVVIAAWAIFIFVSGCAGRSAEPTHAPEAATPAAAAPANADEAAPAAAPEAPSSTGYGPSDATNRSRVPSSTADDEKAQDAKNNELTALSEKLEGSLTLSTPDCGTAWALRDRICDLAQRICDLAGRSADPDVAERCKDGRTRCESATARVRAVCAQ